MLRMTGRAPGSRLKFDRPKENDVRIRIDSAIDRIHDVM
jgi:hypothetical protein